MTDLTSVGGTQPRVSPKNDFVLFTSVNEKTGKRDIYRMSDQGGVPENLTNSPDADDFDPAWSKDGSRIVFASDRVVDDSSQRNFDIWMLDLAKPGEPQRLTSNLSQDDNPIFDLGDSGIFFRSNRGGQWQVWRMAVK
jgi:Tol biopolymer transport system component